MKLLCVFGKHAYGDPARGEGYEHANFLPALHALGHQTVLLESFDRSAYRDFAELNAAFVKALEVQRPDAVLCVLMGYELWTETLDLARRITRAPIINWGTDDSWKYEQFSRYIAPHVDCYATTSAAAYEKALRDGLRNVVLTQWAANQANLQPPLPSHECSYQVTFVGSAYGNRLRWIKAMAERGIAIQCFGYGWPAGAVSAEDIPRIVRGSMVSLNFGDSGLHWRGLRPYRSRQIKARVFEVPGAGGFLLTESAEGLDCFYRDGEEIAVFDGADELADRIRYYLEYPHERDRVARAGYERTAREHTYAQRFTTLLEQAVEMTSKRVSAGERGEPRAAETLQTAIAQHRSSFGVAILRGALVSIFTMLFGKRRGPRAARRLLFELSWRLAGAKTYSARSWPARAFYRES